MPDLRSCCSAALLHLVLAVGGSNAIDSMAAQASEPDTRRPVPEFAADAMRAFFGDARAAYLYDERSLLEQMWTVLGIPDDEDRRATRARDIDGGRVLHIGCRQHSCMEKGAVLYDMATREVLGAGMLRFRCAETPSPVGCAHRPVLTIFVSESKPAPPEVLASIESWADARSPGAERELRALP